MENLIKVIRWNLIANKKLIGGTAIGWFIALLIASLLVTGALWTREAPREGVVSGISFVFLIIVGFVMLHFAASICWNMKTKTEFVNYSMLPATKLEKFWANWFHSTVVMALAILVGIAAADLVQALYTFIFSGIAHSYLLSMLKQSIFPFDCCTTMTAVLVNIFVHSTFVLGGCFFRKHQTLLTGMVWIFVSAFVSFILGGIGAIILCWMEDKNYSMEFEWLLSDGWGIAIIDIVLIALTVFNYWCAFRLFKKMQLINNKIFN